MENKHTIKLSPLNEERAIRAGDFLLLPTNPNAPIIVSQPVGNFNQYTWIESFRESMPVFQQLKSSFNTVNVLKNTKLSWEVRVMDPSNVNDENSTDNLVFLWKKNDAPLYDINQLNNNNGVSGVLIDGDLCVPELTGVYTCEVSNNYGTSETQPLNLNIIDPINHPKLCRNLILNGDGDGGIDGWQTSTDIKTKVLINDAFTTTNFGSFRLGGLITYEKDKKTTGGESGDFYFCGASHQSLYFNWFWKRYTKDPTFKDINNEDSTSIGILTDDERWLETGLIPQIVVNEDYNKSPYAGFFPGIAWMDLYNKNGSKTINLQNEFDNHVTSYFTRGKLKFEKFGGKAQANLTQTIDVSDASDIIDGNVYGVSYATSQFFAYVGAGITDYKIKVNTIDEGVITLNYYISDSEGLYVRIVGENSEFTNDISGKRGRRLALVPGSDIEIIPMVDDTTSIQLDYLDDSNRVLKTEVIDGPNARDVWAIKEKVFFPITLYPLFESVAPSNNNVLVFGQKYTNTDALLPLFKYNTMFDRTGSRGIKRTITDKNAKFLLNKYDFKEWGSAYPNNSIWYVKEDSKNKALNDHGAAAMFGVGRNIVVPRKTRFVKITVNFTHTSEIIKDTTPELKGWTSQELYSDVYGQYTGTSRRLIEYGAPRCGITKMKFIMTANNVEITDEFSTYQLPPAEATVLGLQKKQYTIANAFNSADAVDFKYSLIQPETMPTPPTINNPFVVEQTYIAYQIAAEQRDGTLINPSDNQTASVSQEFKDLVASEDDEIVS